ncbi:hypothetical protein BDA96_10G092200 [Sorghum bicolor]|uniref:Uncharacterized protein n=1 Tax=Sorghum bicolor TaxID=4558 RepID=A0A921TZR4_SORBI|nr:hypothetical protein BDA96_10G092200 [Sorghum bicolor]
MRRDERRRARQLAGPAAGCERHGHGSRSSPGTPQRGPGPAALGFGGGVFRLCGLRVPLPSPRRRQPAPAGDRVVHALHLRWCSPVLAVRADSRWRGRGSRRASPRAWSGCAPCLARCCHGDLFSGNHADCRRAYPRRRRRWRWYHRSRRRGADPGSRGAPVPQQDGFGRCGRTGLPHGHSRPRRLLLMALMKKNLEEALGGYRQDSWKYPGIALPSTRRFLLHFKIMNICNNIQMDVVLNTTLLCWLSVIVESGLIPGTCDWQLIIESCMCFRHHLLLSNKGMCVVDNMLQ